MRYKNTKPKYQKYPSRNGRAIQSLRTTYYSVVPESDADTYLIAQEGDRLDILAAKFYGNPRFWWFIARTNNLYSMNVPAGTSLRISPHTNLAIGY